MIPSIGRIVHYTLSAHDATQINRLRSALRANIPDGSSVGPMVHTGNEASEGQVFPAMIVRTWGDTPESVVQLQVFLDGNDTFWATSRGQGDGQGQWREPPRV